MFNGSNCDRKSQLSGIFREYSGIFREYSGIFREYSGILTEPWNPRGIPLT